MTVNAEDIAKVVHEMPKNKTSGRDMLVAEVWAAAIAADGRQTAQLAWATNQRIANSSARSPPGPPSPCTGHSMRTATQAGEPTAMARPRTHSR